MENYVVSIRTAAQRRQHVAAEFNKHQIAFHFFDAVTPETLAESIAEHCPNLADAFLTGGEKGCFMSHVCLWAKCVADDLPYIGIFEDDVIFGRNSSRFLNDTKWLDERFQNQRFIIRMETFLKANPVVLSKSGVRSFNGRKILRLQSFGFGTAAYLISQQTAIALLNWIREVAPEKLEPIDNMLFNAASEIPEIQMYQISPALCIQELQLNRADSSLSSTLEDGRLARHQQLDGGKTQPERTQENRNIFEWAKNKIVKEYKRMKRRWADDKKIVPFK